MSLTVTVMQRFGRVTVGRLEARQNSTDCWLPDVLAGNRQLLLLVGGVSTGAGGGHSWGILRSAPLQTAANLSQLVVAAAARKPHSRNPAPWPPAHLEALDCILQAGHEVHVCVHGLVTNIALHKDLPRRQPQDLVGLWDMQETQASTAQQAGQHVRRECGSLGLKELQDIEHGCNGNMQAHALMSSMAVPAQ